MFLTMFKGKIHRATVTEANLKDRKSVVYGKSVDIGGGGMI